MDLFSEAAELAEENGLKLISTEDGITLADGDLSLRGDFTRLLPRIRQNKANTEYVTRAVRMKEISPLTVLDATAGLGEDSFLLAAAGFQVTLYEKDPVIACLLEDAVKRGMHDPELRNAVCNMQVIRGDSILAMREIAATKINVPDVILLDPMFPERQKTALVKKKFQLIHQIEVPCEDEAALLDSALLAAPKKIVIKRPPKGPFLAGKKPSYSLQGKNVRYDCIVL